MTAVEVKEIVQAGLKRHEEGGKEIKVVGVGHQPTDGQWQVLVEPATEEPKPRYHYYDLLGRVEEDIHDHDGLFVFLTPAPEGTYLFDISGEIYEVKKRVETLVVSPKARPLSQAFFDKDGHLLINDVHLDDHRLEPYKKALLRYFERDRQAA